MALITQIRKHFWFVLILLGLALAAFIMMDMNASSNLGGGTSMTVGEIAGKKVDWNEFQSAENILYSGQQGNLYARREGLWNYFVQDAVVNKEAEEIGISVTDEEMRELQFGANLSPVIQRNFADQRTGQLNMEALNNFRQGLDAGTLPQQSLDFWNFQEGQIKTDRLQSKMNNLVLKGMYVPDWSVEKRHFENNNKADFAYVKIPFDDIDDADVAVTDEDLEAYINANSGLYTNTEQTRSLVYVGFDVLPSAQDTADLLASILDQKAEMLTQDDDSLYITNNYGIINDAYIKGSALSDSLQANLINEEIGGYYGPYIEGIDYRIAKLIDKKIIPDSVEVRHILMSAKTQEEAARTVTLIDSIKAAIENGTAQFDSMAIRFSQDPGSGAKGGDLGYAAQGSMVAQFNNLIFYRAEVGKLYKVATQFGLHLVEVTDKKFLSEDLSYRIGYLREPIIPSEETQDIGYDIVSTFIAENRSYADLEASVNADETLGFEVVNNLTRNTYEITGLGAETAGRDMIKWAFDGNTDPGNVSPEVYIFEDAVNYFNSKYVVAALTAINEPGLASVSSRRQEIEGKVRKEKKGQAIISKINGTDLAAIASSFGTSVDTARAAVFISAFIPGVGSEPAVVGEAFGLKEQSTGNPVIGNTGVYMVKNLGVQRAQDPTNFGQLRKINASQFPTRVNNDLMDALKKGVEIKDNRATYY